MRKRALCLAAVLLLCMLTGGCSLFRKSDDVLPHLIDESEAESAPVRPIDGVTDTRGFTATTVSGQMDELLDIVYKPERISGTRPDFTNALPEVQAVYDAAVAVCNRYIRNDFSDYERVHALHDWLAYYVQYDFDVPASAPSDHASFSLTGVFNERKAVCDGFTKAMNLLCGIEQIPCVRITGQYDQGDSSVNHAWNKLCLGGVWYNVDATLDSCHVYTDGDTRADILCHGYFLVSDAAMEEEIVGKHTAYGTNKVNYACERDYPFYGTTALGIGSYSMEITSQAALNDVFAAVKKSKRKIGKLELRLRFEGYDASNLRRADAYLPEIAEAYGKVSDADFVLDASSGAYPYRRYPGGVFVFLIYK